MNETMQIIDGLVLMSGGLLLASAILFGLAYLSGMLAAHLFKTLRRTYHLSVIGYWLERLEQGGKLEFKRAEQHGKNIKAVKDSAANGETK